MMNDLERCKKDIVYFYENYVNVNGKKPCQLSINNLKNYTKYTKDMIIFEYMDYIDNILKRNLLDDLNIHNQFDSTYSRDGIVYTLPLEKTIEVIKNRFNVNIRTYSDDKIMLTGLTDKADFYKPLLSNIGYMITSFDNDTMFIEPYCDSIIESTPEYLYYVSIEYNDYIYIEPKFYKEYSVNPNRILLYDDLDFCHQLGQLLGYDYYIYKINTKESNCQIYSDITLGGKVFYTTCDIKGKYISMEFSF